MKQIRNPALIFGVVMLTACVLLLYVQQITSGTSVISGTNVIFPLMLLYHNLWWVFALLLIGIVVLIVIWAIRAWRHRSRAFIVPILLLALSVPILCHLSLRAAMLNAEMLTTARLNGEVYYLILRSTGYHFYILYVCDSQGWQCDSVHTEVTGPSLPPEIALIVDETAKTVTFQFGDEVVYVHNAS